MKSVFEIFKKKLQKLREVADKFAQLTISSKQQILLTFKTSETSKCNEEMVERPKNTDLPVKWKRNWQQKKIKPLKLY